MPQIPTGLGSQSSASFLENGDDRGLWHTIGRHLRRWMVGLWSSIPVFIAFKAQINLRMIVCPILILIAVGARRHIGFFHLSTDLQSTRRTESASDLHRGTDAFSIEELVWWVFCHRRPRFSIVCLWRFMLSTPIIVQLAKASGSSKVNSKFSTDLGLICGRWNCCRPISSSLPWVLHLAMWLPLALTL